MHKSHNVSVLMYHMVCPAQYRKAVFDKSVDEEVKVICLEISKRYEINFYDCDIYVKSKRAGERVKESMTRFIEKRLKLKVNEDKSVVDLPRNRRQIAPESVARFKIRVRQLTRRNWSISMEERIDRLSKYMKGWQGYFGYCETSAILKELDGWVRRSLTCVY